MKLANPIGRSTEEWVGKTADTPIPMRVKMRVLERHGRTCYWTDREIRPGDQWDTDHIKALSLGGENRESNLAPILVTPHKIKTKQDRLAKKKADDSIKSQYGIKRAKHPVPGSRSTRYQKKMDGTVVDRRTGKRI